MTDKNVLIIDDEPDIRELLEITLLRMGLNTYTAGTVKEALAHLNTQPFDLCLTDMKLPDGTGIDIVNYIQHHCPDLPIAVITAFGNMETAVESLTSGAYDYVTKPVNVKKLRELVEKALNISTQQQQRGKSSGKIKEKAADNVILGNSEVIINLNKTIKKLSRSQVPIHIYGESGSGKELVAKNIHCNGSEEKRPFIPVNCGAIPENLMESEFFGHKKGSFTGALDDRDGLFQAANGGTLFLDEVADLPLDMQVKLLRAIQEKAVKPVGGTEEVKVTIRILSATHKDLETEVAEGRFREDLYYRLNVIKLEVPPLRVRGNDILLLADYLLEKITQRWQMDQIILSEEAKMALSYYSFPGNVRELVNTLERAATLCESGVIAVNHLQLPKDKSLKKATTIPSPTAERIPTLSIPSWERGALSAYEEKRMLLTALEKTRWNRTKAAKSLGMSFRQLRYRIKKYKLETTEINEA
jgi:two-component system response regulator PilR (NtrC family)